MRNWEDYSEVVKDVLLSKKFLIYVQTAGRNILGIEMTYAKRIDGNQNAVVRAFRASNFSVAITSSLGRGFPDLVVGINLGGKLGYWTSLIEIKDGSKPLSAQKLTPDEVKFRENWTGNYHIIRSVADVAVLLDTLLKGE